MPTEPPTEERVPPGFASRPFRWNDAESQWDLSNGDSLISVSIGPHGMPWGVQSDTEIWVGATQ